MHTYSLGVGGRRTCTLRGGLLVNIDLHYEHFYWQRHPQPAAECNARTHASTTEQQNYRKQGREGDGLTADSP